MEGNLQMVMPTNTYIQRQWQEDAEINPRDSESFISALIQLRNFQSQLQIFRGQFEAHIEFSCRDLELSFCYQGINLRVFKSILLTLQPQAQELRGQLQNCEAIFPISTSISGISKSSLHTSSQFCMDVKVESQFLGL